jgi:hypothetical protein
MIVVLHPPLFDHLHRLQDTPYIISYQYVLVEDIACVYRPVGQDLRRPCRYRRGHLCIS